MIAFSLGLITGLAIGFSVTLYTLKQARRATQYYKAKFERAARYVHSSLDEAIVAAKEIEG